MHIDYAKEQFLSRAKPKHSKPFNDLELVQIFAHEKEFLALADSLGVEKISSIVKTIREGEGNKYFKVTSLQKYAIADALIKSFGAAKAVYAAAFHSTVSLMFGDLPAIELSSKRIWFSKGAFIACVVETYGETIESVSVHGNHVSVQDDVDVSDCFPASVAAIENCEKSGMGTDIVSVNYKNQIIFVSREEAKDHDLSEIGVMLKREHPDVGLVQQANNKLGR